MGDETRKALFRSPTPAAENIPADSEPVTSKYQLELDMVSCLHQVVKDQHEQRLKQLKQGLKTLSEDNWKYTPAEKLIGLHD